METFFELRIYSEHGLFLEIKSCTLSRKNKGGSTLRGINEGYNVKKFLVKKKEKEIYL